MDSKICMNSSCSASSTTRWKNGWPLRSGGFANLCDKCGSAYDQFVFCDMFHSKESGWRECNSCGKRLHCGCIASKSSLELLDSGGVKCISCMKDSNISSIPSQVPQGSILQSPHKVLALASKSSRDGKLDDFVMLSTSQDYKMDDDAIDRGKIMQHSKEMEHTGRSTILVAETNNPNESLGKTKKEQGAILVEAGSVCFSNINQTQVGSLQIIKRDESKESLFDKEAYESPTHACLSITFGTSNLGQVEASNSTPGTSNLLLPIPTVIAEGKEQSKGSSSFQHGHRSRHLLPRPSNKSPSTGSESSKDMLPQIRVARPPAEGRGRNQLLPRYWPRITDQELQQITGDSNSTIVPLFEKVLSASDAGRIGRLVLPKACAEAYFPPISQPEGLPLKIQDAKGKDWLFQFRFWPNNNSRMYVLEGVTPCIQSMQLQAGDTVTFSRIDPEGKLVMGFRKATNSLSLQDAQISSLANCGIANETFISGVLENLPSISGYSGLLNSLKGSADPHLNTSFEQINQSDADICWNKSEKHEGRMPFQSVPGQERKRSRNLSSKSKRLHMDCEDALELKLTWEEAQDLLRPPPSVKPSIVVIEDHEFEEYEEPPVFGKRTIFTARPSGGHDQWAQCDICCRWRRLPVDALLPPRWTCSDNIWDPRRCSCSAPDEMSSKELDDLLRLTIDFKKRRSGVSQKSAFEREVSGLDALATAAVLGDNGNSGTPSVSATTTKHPRHRPGCTCIVCIQPPSGKGPKHKPTCTCNVCMTVKRRFKTLMLRKKKRQSEREAETARKKLHAWTKDEAEVDSSSRCLSMSNLPENEALLVNTPESGQARIMAEKAETGSSFSACFKEDMSKGGIDLNCHPERDDDLQVGSSRVSMMSLLQVASLPLDTYLKQHGLASLICEQQLSSGSHVQALGVGDSEGRPVEESYYTSVVQDNETVGDDGFYVPDQPQEDTV